MQTALRLTTWVLPGGKIEVTNSQLPAGKAVDIIVLFSQDNEVSNHSLTDVLAEAPGHLSFQNAEEVDAYLQTERNGWEH